MHHAQSPRGGATRRLVITLIVALSGVLSGCGILRIDPSHVLLRSDVILSLEQEREIVRRAEVTWSDDGRIRILTVRGTPYERGYQQGFLLRREVQDNLLALHREALRTFRSEELFDEAYERMRPFIPQEYIDEMHGLAHGSRLPLRVIHAIHALPSMTEWGGKKRLKGIVKQMMAGELATSCSNLSASEEATSSGQHLVVRVLDWGLHKISKLHEYPLITISVPDSGAVSANFGWVGFLGAVSGINEHGITLGEMGYKDPPYETLRGKPMPFLLRDVLSYAAGLPDVRKIITESTPDMSFVFLMTDGKTGEAQMYIRDPRRFIVADPSKPFTDELLDEAIPPVPNAVYGGHFNDRMTKNLSDFHGAITPELLMTTIIPDIAMRSNFQNVIYAPRDLTVWIANAPSKSVRAAEAPYSKVNIGELFSRGRASPITPVEGMP